MMRRYGILNAGQAARMTAIAAAQVVLVCIVACLPSVLSAADINGTKIAGTWKISAPQSSFKPEGGGIPFTRAGKKRYEENKRHRAKGEYDEYDYSMSRCSSPGMPRMMLTSDRFRIYIRSGYVQFSFEWNRLIRQIGMTDLWTQQEAAISLEDSPRTFGSVRGDSKGHWEGDTLVVSTDNFTDKTLIDALVPHGLELRVTERIRLKDIDTLENRITIEDPEYFTRPWKTVVTYKRQADELFPEDFCLDRLESGKPALPR